MPLQRLKTCLNAVILLEFSASVQLMISKDIVTKEGIVKEALMGAMFRVELDDGELALASLSGKMRRFHITVLPGDKVKIEFSPHDLTRGRISYRFRD